MYYDIFFQIACEKFVPAEKNPKDRDNQAAAKMIKVGFYVSMTYYTYVWNLLKYYIYDSKDHCVEIA